MRIIDKISIKNYTKQVLKDLFSVIISKCFITALCLIIFLTSHTLFTYNVANFHFEVWERDLWKSYSYSFIFISMYILIKAGITSYIQKQFIEVTFFCVLFTFVITLLTNNLVVTEPYKLMYVVDIGTILATVMILISAARHGLLKN